MQKQPEQNMLRHNVQQKPLHRTYTCKAPAPDVRPFYGRKHTSAAGLLLILFLLASLTLTGCGTAAGAMTDEETPGGKTTLSQDRADSGTASEQPTSGAQEGVSGSRGETGSQTQTGGSASSGQEETAGSAGGRETNYEFRMPEAPGETVLKGVDSYVDISNTANGYVTACYQGEAELAKLQLTGPDENVYTYNLMPDEPDVFPLTAGDGTYTVAILEQVYDDKYSYVLFDEAEVKLEDEFQPYLYPNQYVKYEADDAVTLFGEQLSEQSVDDLDYLQRVYHYVIENITYDTELAENLPKRYLPVPTETLESGTGICFDYAALMAALLRSQNIPVKLVVGYSGTVYHAWISVYLDEIGWVDNIIEFDGSSWSLMDPTLAANNRAEFVSEYIGDGDNYLEKYWY